MLIFHPFAFSLNPLVLQTLCEVNLEMAFPSIIDILFYFDGHGLSSFSVEA